MSLSQAVFLDVSPVKRMVIFHTYNIHDNNVDSNMCTAKWLYKNEFWRNKRSSLFKKYLRMSNMFRCKIFYKYIINEYIAFVLYNILDTFIICKQINLAHCYFPQRTIHHKFCEWYWQVPDTFLKFIPQGKGVLKDHPPTANPAPTHRQTVVDQWQPTSKQSVINRQPVATQSPTDRRFS